MIGTSDLKWRFKTKTLGLQQVQLKAPRLLPGKFLLNVNARRWFAAAAANQQRENTFLTVTIGAQCFRSP